MKPIYYGKQTIDKDDIDAVVQVLNSELITTGPKAKEFEKVIAKQTNARYCVAVSNGTAALHLGSLALLNKKDKVLTTPNSFLATSNSILYVGAKPVFVDICEDGSIDFGLCEKELKKDNTIKAIYAVSFSGKPLNQEKLAYLKEKYKVKILCDNAHSIGSTFQGCSDISTYSFHPVKNITTGEGGAITTNSKEIYEKLLSLRNHGMVKTDDMLPWEYEMTSLGFNNRITDFQCALGLSQLKKLDDFLAKRREIAKFYHDKLKNTQIKPLYNYDKTGAYHLFVVRYPFKDIEQKTQFFKDMQKKGIFLQLHYIPINKQPYYKDLGYGDEKTPIMDRYYLESFSLPIYPTLSQDKQEYVIKCLMECIDV